MDDADSAAIAAQHTPQTLAEQPKRLADSPGWPWTILAIWLSIHLVAVMYWALWDWPGFLGDLWLLFVCAGDLIGLTCWVVAWATLAQQELILRLAYLFAGLAGIAGLGWPMFLRGGSGDLEFVASPLAAIAWGVAALLMLLRRRGWRIQSDVDRALAPGCRSQPWWQFSVSDVLLATTSMGLFLALLLFGGPLQLNEVVLVLAHVIGTTAVLIASLAWRRFVLAVSVALLAVAMVVVGVLLILEPESMFRLGDIGMLLLWVGPVVLGLLLAAGLLRWSGYRLSPESPESLAATRGGVNTKGFPPGPPFFR